MTYPKQFSGGLLALCVSIGLQANVSAATDAPADFHIMSPAEIAAHSATMETLQGSAREDYRNAQYEQLKKRALKNGFTLPADPPWAASGTVAASEGSNQASPAAATTKPAEPVPGADTTAETAARHAEMREKLQARREAMQQASEANLKNLQQAANAQQQQVEEQLQTKQQSEVQAPSKEAARGQAPADKPVPPAPTSESATVQITESAPPSSTTPAQDAMGGTPPAPAPVAPAEPVATPATASASVADSKPHYAPVESTAIAAPRRPARPVPPAPPTRPAPMPMHPAQADAGMEAAAAPSVAVGSAGQPYAAPDAMNAYRENMRSRFDEYMQERQAQMEEKARQQREQHEASMEQSRSMQPNRGHFQPPPYPAMPAYGPRYPTAYPGYRTPYWQQR